MRKTCNNPRYSKALYYVGCWSVYVSYYWKHRLGVMYYMLSYTVYISDSFFFLHFFLTFFFFFNILSVILTTIMERKHVLQKGIYIYLHHFLHQQENYAFECQLCNKRKLLLIQYLLYRYIYDHLSLWSSSNCLNKIQYYLVYVRFWQFSTGQIIIICFHRVIYTNQVSSLI